MVDSNLGNKRRGGRKPLPSSPINRKEITQEEQFVSMPEPAYGIHIPPDNLVTYERDLQFLLNPAYEIDEPPELPRFTDPKPFDRNISGKIQILPADTKPEHLLSYIENNQIVGFLYDDFPGYLNTQVTSECFICGERFEGEEISKAKQLTTHLRTCYKNDDDYEIFFVVVNQCPAPECPMIFINNELLISHYGKIHEETSRVDYKRLRVLWGGINNPWFLADPRLVDYSFLYERKKQDDLRMESSYYWRLTKHLKSTDNALDQKKAWDYDRNRLTIHPILYENELTKEPSTHIEPMSYFPCQVEVLTADGTYQHQELYDIQSILNAIETPHHYLLLHTRPGAVTNAKHYACIKCESKCETGAAIRKHLLHRHNIAVLEIHICLVINCSKIFRKKETVLSHLRTIHGDIDGISDKHQQILFLVWTWKPNKNEPAIDNPSDVIQDPEHIPTSFKPKEQN